MKLASVTLAYNDETTIGGTLRCLKPFVETQIVLISEKPYFGKETEPDRTEEIALDLGAEVVKGEWSLDHDQRSLGNSLCSDCDWVLAFDSDEMMEFKELDRFIRFLETAETPAVGIQPEIYWYDIYHRLRPKPSYTPIIAMKPSVRFTYIRNIDSPFQLYDGGEMHHLSWCKPKDIYKKVTSYAHATDFDGEKWYMDKFLKWEEGMRAELPDGTYDVIYNPLPEELKKHLTY